MTAEKIRQARALLTRPDETISPIAQLLSASRVTLYKYAPETTASGLPAGQRASPPDMTHCDSPAAFPPGEEK
jgi:hypothetical protein